MQQKNKFLRSDREGEYLSYEFGLHLKQCGIVLQLMPPGTPHRNGVSEHRNRALLDMVRSMMSLTDLPLSFWGHELALQKKDTSVTFWAERNFFLLR